MSDPKKKLKDAIVARQVLTKDKPKQLPARLVETSDRAKICRLLTPKVQTND